MFGFHGTDTQAIGGKETIQAVANLVACDWRNKARVLTPEMKVQVAEIDDDIVVSYLALCDLLGQRTARNNVFLREVSPQSIVSQIRKVNGLRELGLDVFTMGHARFGRGDVGLLITSKFKEDAKAIPSFFRECKTEFSMSAILNEGRRLNKSVSKKKRVA